MTTTIIIAIVGEYCEASFIYTTSRQLADRIKQIADDMGDGYYECTVNHAIKVEGATTASKFLKENEEI